MSSTKEEKPIIAISNASKKTLDSLANLVGPLKSYELKVLDDLQRIIENPPSYQPVLLIVDGQNNVAQSYEATQALKMIFTAPLFVLHGSEFPVDFELFKKNGADLLVHFHFDKEFIIDLILESAPIDFGDHIPLAALNTINLDEINPEIEINFDLYLHLPSNQRTILFRRKENLIDSGTLQKTKEANQKLYFKKTESKQFLEYARTSLTMKNDSKLISLTEKQLKAKKTIFKVMVEFFNSQFRSFETGRGILERCREVLNEYDLLTSKPPSQLFEQLYLVCGQNRSFYNDAIYLANFSALVGHFLALPESEIECLALAGLLHNLGLSQVDEYSLGMSLESLSASQKARYLEYPERSVFLVKTQKVPLPDDVSMAILQHRELANGKGFPHQLASDQTTKIAKILQIALSLYEMTSLVDGQPRYRLKAAVEKMEEDVGKGESPFDIPLQLEFFKAFKKSFPQ